MNAIDGIKMKAQPKDVTTVGRALAACDPGLLMECMMEMEAGARFALDPLDEATICAFAREVADYVAAVRRCIPEGAQPSGCGGCGAQAPGLALDEPLPGLVIPLEWYEVEDACGMIRHRLGAALLSSEAASVAQEVLNRSGGYAYELAEVYAAERLVPAIGSLQPWAWEGLRASACWFSVEPWQRIVQTPIWLPEALEPKERYLVLAHVLWMMTRCGLGAATATEGLREANREAQRSRLVPVPRRLVDPAEGEEGPEPLFAGASMALDAFDLSPFEESYVQRLSNIVRLLNYNCWIDALEACVALDG